VEDLDAYWLAKGTEQLKQARAGEPAIGYDVTGLPDTWLAAELLTFDEGTEWELGATHIINHANRTDVVAEIRRITGNGARFALETSALPAVFREAVEALTPAGMCVLVGTARSGTEVTFEMPVMQNGRTVRGVIQGDSQPDEFIPLLVDLMMDGKLPAERMMTFYDLADINRAAKDSSEGRTIKPVLRMPH